MRKENISSSVWQNRCQYNCQRFWHLQECYKLKTPKPRDRSCSQLTGPNRKTVSGRMTSYDSVPRKTMPCTDGACSTGVQLSSDFFSISTLWMDGKITAWKIFLEQVGHAGCIKINKILLSTFSIEITACKSDQHTQITHLQAPIALVPNIKEVVVGAQSYVTPLLIETDASFIWLQFSNNGYVAVPAS